MLASVLLSIQAASGVLAPSDKLRVSPSMPRCEAGPEGEVVVCGKRPDRFRLPLPSERDRLEAADHRGGTGLAALTSPTRCGIFVGERPCGKREAEGYGYGKGRDPISLLLRAGAVLLDPDAEVGEAP